MEWAPEPFTGFPFLVFNQPQNSAAVFAEDQAERPEFLLPLRSRSTPGSSVRSAVLPAQGLATKEMKMKMRNTFARVLAVVDDHPEARLRDSQLRRNRCSDDEQITQKLLIACFRRGKTRNFFFRDEKRMDLGDRMDVVNRDAAFVFVNHVGR